MAMRFPKKWLWPGLTLLSLAGAGWLWRENVRLEAQLARWRAEAVSARVAHQLQPAPPGLASVSPPAATQPAAAATSAAPDPAQAVLDGLRGQVLVSFGTVEKLGAQAAEFFASEQARRLRKQAGTLGSSDLALTPEEEAEGQRQTARLLGALPEIESFQDHPDEYGRFFRGLFQAGGALSESDAARVETLMKARAEEGIKLGLNAGSKPKDGALAWEWKRDQFNEATADQLSNVLPDTAKENFPINGALMEFLEMDFDKAGLTVPLPAAPTAAAAPATQ